MDKDSPAARAREPATPASETHVRRRSRTQQAASVAAEAHPQPKAQSRLEQQNSNPGSQSISKWLIGALSILLGLAVLSRTQLVSSWSQILPYSLSNADSESNYTDATLEHWWTEKGRGLDIPLNPQKHIHRPSALLELDWVVTAGFRRPDGVKKRVYLVNDEFPGPTVEARSGDELRISVRNNLTEGEDIAIHWHGLRMKLANDMDGAVGFTQCPIQPGQSFIYQFKIEQDQHGTFWYHAHDQVQRADGLLGGFIVHEPAIERKATAVLNPPTYDDDERLLLIGDWYHRSATNVMKWYMRAGSFGMEPVPDSLVVNHGGAYTCADGVPARPVDCVQIQPNELPAIQVNHERRYRFRVVNTGTLAGFTLRFAGASILPFEVDGGNAVNSNGSVESVGILYPGERVDFVASWSPYQNSDVVASSLEIELDGENFKYPNPALTHTHRFPIFINATAAPTGPANVNPDGRHFSLVSATSPNASTGFDSPEVANVTLLIYATTMKLSRLSNVPYGFMNHTSWQPQDNPALPLISIPRSQWDKYQLVPHIKSSAQDPAWVDLVINNLDDGSHPFHLHGYDFWVLSTHYGGKSYWGSYNPFEAPDGPPGGPYNLVDPVRKDTVFVPRRGYVVLRFRADNEGIWMFHCHILWHQASGMAMGFQIGLDDANTAPLDSLNLSNREQLQETCKER